MKVSFIQLAVAASIAVFPANGQTKQKPPEGGPPKPFSLPPAQDFQLRNGVRVTIVPYGAVPKTSLRVVVQAGNINEGPNQVWLADVTGELLKLGTASRTAAQIAEQAAGMGGQLLVGVGPDTTTIGADVLADYSAEMVALLGDVVQHAALPEAELSRIRKDMLRRLAIEKAEPGAIASEAFAKTIYKNHPYGRLYPTEAMLNSYTIADVREFYRSNFGGERTHIYVAGKFGAGLRDAITAAFETWQKGSAPVNNVPKTAAVKTFELIDRPGAAQSVIRFGLPVPPPTNADYIPLAVTNSLLGGSFASRITTNIREQKGYTYSPFSMIETHRHDAYWAEMADVTTAVTGPAVQEIVNEIVRLRKEPPSSEELRGIQNYMAGVFVISNSSRRGVIQQLRFVDLQGLGEGWLRQYVPNVLKVTPADVQRIAEKYLSPDKMTLVVLGDKTKVADQLKAFQQ